MLTDSNHETFTSIQDLHITESVSQNKFNLHDHSARVIQRTWFNYQDRTIYKLLTMSIKVLKSINPKLIVRKLAPREFLLLNDKAFQLDIIFKLEASTEIDGFPPNVVYKIIVNNPARFNFNTKMKGGKIVEKPVTCNNWRHLTIEPLINFIPQNEWNRQMENHQNNNFNDSQDISGVQPNPVGVSHNKISDFTRQSHYTPASSARSNIKFTRSHKFYKNQYRPVKSKMVPGYFQKYIQNYFDEELKPEEMMGQNLAGRTYGSSQGARIVGQHLEPDFVNSNYSHDPDFVNPGGDQKRISRPSPKPPGTSLSIKHKSFSRETKREMTATSDLLPSAQVAFEKTLQQDNLEIDPELVNWVDNIDHDMKMIEEDVI